MKQIFYTGDLPHKVVIEDGRFTEHDRRILSEDEISEIQANPEKVVFFRRYISLSEKGGMIKRTCRNKECEGYFYHWTSQNVKFCPYCGKKLRKMSPEKAK